MTALRFGMPTLVEFDDLEVNVELCRHLGLSFVKLNMNSPLFSPAALPAEQLKQVAREGGTRVVIEVKTAAALETSVRELDDRALR